MIRGQPLGIVQHPGCAVRGELEMLEAAVRSSGAVRPPTFAVGSPDRASMFSVNRPNGSMNGSKCALPISAVRYPPRCRCAATDGASTGNGTPFIHTPCVLGCCPVRIVDRDGMHTTDWGTARSKRTPLAASASTTGVRANVPPLQPSVSYRCWSVVTNKMLRPT